MPGWSDSLIHSALLDLRLTVQLLPINVKTRRGQKKENEKKKEKRRKRGEQEEKEDDDDDDVKFESSLLLHCEVGHQEVAQLYAVGLPGLRQTAQNETHSTKSAHVLL